MLHSKPGPGVEPVVFCAETLPLPSRSGPYRDWGKRLLDVVVATLGLVVTAPLIVVLAAIVAMDGGNPIYAHERVGQHGRLFACLKLRTMRRNSDDLLLAHLKANPAAAAEWAAYHKLADDPRVTLFGRLLRKTSFDELPQLWNVLRGDMSIVGPRPVTAEELELYSVHLAKYLAVRPGLTGIWQVYGRGRVAFDQRITMDTDYYGQIDMQTDLKLMAQTVIVMAQGRGQ